jgi:hypothetical protein
MTTDRLKDVPGLQKRVLSERVESKSTSISIGSALASTRWIAIGPDHALFACAVLPSLRVIAVVHRAVEPSGDNEVRTVASTVA